MDSALRPREIQARIRAGQSLDEVARLSGEPADRIERFATPVLAEREHVAGLALTSTVRRRGELGGHRSLRAVVGDRLMAHGVDPDSVAWDAWRNEDKRWTVQAAWTQDEQQRSARFQFDLVSRFSVADDPQSRWLIAEDEESVERDELALVHAVGGDPNGAGSPATTRRADPDEEPTISLSDEPAGFQVASLEDDWVPRSAATPQEIREELEAEIDGYGVVPEGRSELDVLYDMLSGIAEDSINIYAGLTDPVVSEPAEPREPESADEAQSPREAQSLRETQSPGEARPAPELTGETAVEQEARPLEPSAGAAPGDESPDHTSPPGPARPAADPSAPAASAVEAPTDRPVPSADRPEPAGVESVATETVPSEASAETSPGPSSATARSRSVAEPPQMSSSHTAGPGIQPTSAAPTPPQIPDPTPDAGAAGGTADADTRQAAEAGQPALVADEPTIQVPPGASKRRGARKKRASVPSWDEIMFGGPKRD